MVCDWCEGAGCEECANGGGAMDGNEDADDWDMKETLEDEQLLAGIGRKNSYVFLTDPDVEERQSTLVTKTAQELDISNDEADCLLRCYLWNVEKSSDDWYSDREKTRKKGVPASRVDKNPPAEVQCSTALCDKVARKDANALGCGHWFCNDCWAGFVKAEVAKGPDCIYSVCMGYNCTKKKCKHEPQDNCKCQSLLPTSFFRHYLSPDLRVNYDKWMRKAFIENNKQLYFCPANGCSNVIEYKKDNPTREITCKCGHTFCFKCGLDAHLPVPCDLAQRFLALDSSDALTAKLIAAITKNCPKCKVPIQKNEACIHMTCAKCKAQWCWLCKADWSGHGGSYYSCAKYNESKEKGTLSDEQQLIINNTKELQKYNLYRESYNKYKKLVEVNTKFIGVVERNTSIPVDKTKFLVDAAQQLAAGHRLLQWSYCLSYFLAESKEKKLFLYQQDQLQNLAKELHDFLDGKSLDLLCDKRDHIVNLARTVEKFRKSTLEALDAGQLIEVILNAADNSNDAWACTKCATVITDKEAKACPKCSACRLHGEKSCWGCTPRT